MITYAFFSKNVKERLDPYYLILQKNLRKLRYKFPLVSLETLLKENPQYGANEIAIDGNPGSDTRYVRITDIDKYGKLKNEEWKTAKNINEKYLLKDDDVLFARSGATAGKTFIYNNSVGKAIFAGYLIKFKVDASKANPKFIFYFTQLSPYTEWVKSIQRPSGQPNINSKEFKSINISLPPRKIQDMIVEIMQTAYKKREQKLKQADELLNSIDDYIREQLGIDFTEPEDKRTYAVNAQELQDKRHDPYYYKPNFISLEKTLLNNKAVKLGTLLKSITNGLDYRKFSDEGTLDYLRVSNVKPYKIDYSDAKKVKLNRADIRKNIFGGKNDVLLTRKGTYGVSVSLQQDLDALISSEVFLLKIDTEKVDPHYLSIFLNSSLGQKQFLRNKVGAIMGSLSQEAVKDTYVIIPSKVKQADIINQVNKQIKESTELQQQGEMIVEEAKKKVEEMILN